MQVKKRKRFSTLAAGTQLWNKHASLPIRYCYVAPGSGFTPISESNSDKIRPWMER